MSNNHEKNLYIFTAPSGAGKTTLIKRLVDYAKKQQHKVHLSISHTTREPRAGEQSSKDYYFISDEEFNKNIIDKKYLEYAVVHGNLYGTPKTQIDQKLADGNKVFLEIDWQGALKILKIYPKAESIFISPPSIDQLRKRLEDRGLDTKEVIEKRIKGAALEMKKAVHFKHQIVNISLDTATKNLINIIFGENNGKNYS
ncbi:MAG: guanylate kinase [SAR86 cluster bacterium]|uniref:Guanylate kinase n=1 Tax=SAR86 cluster bacterium TaxID=2030880 RepID=A0A937ID06_9GAMM|nr:guanylate kinase [SAR86 cluster bacterium]